jgi:hypothetical protein
MTYGYRGPSIDHSLLSPSGRMSKRARAAAMKRETERLFAGVGDLRGTVAQPSERARLLHWAKELRIMAARGMSVRKFTREAEKLEVQAASLPA